MRLFMSTGSPFVRKCRVVVREKGLTERVEEQLVDFPYKTDAALLAANPIGQVPALIAEDGQPLTNSSLICAYLDSLSGAPRLLPDGDEYWRVMRVQTLADGLMEMTVKLVLENRRGEGEKSSTWQGYWNQGLRLALHALEERHVQPEGDLDLGDITTCIALTYLDFRFPDLDWRSEHPRLAALQALLERRPSFTATTPR